MNGKLKTIRKHYDKLTPDERIKLMNAADVRGDGDELRVLMNTAPKIGYTVRHHYGIRVALTDLEIAEALSFCHLAAELYRVLFLRMATMGDLHKLPKGDLEALEAYVQRAEFLDKSALALSRGLLAHRAAWQELADEWGLDWQELVDKFGVIDSALKVAEHHLGDEAIDAADVLAELRAFVNTVRAEWE